MRKLEQAALALDRSLKNIADYPEVDHGHEVREQEHGDVSEAYRESGPIEKQMGDRATDNDFKADLHKHSACNMQVGLLRLDSEQA
jgi:hypothetical protein